MKNLLFLILSILSFFNLSAQQEWAPIGAQWHYKLGYAFSPNTSFNFFESVGDTVINNQSCRIITRLTDGCTNIGNKAYMYSENNQVFYFNPFTENFSLFYDFNAEAGDSWVVEDWGNNFFVSTYDTTYTVNVLNTDTVEYNGTMLKRMMVHYGNPNQVDTIIEKFGGTTKMFQFEYPLCDDSHDTGLRCYEDPDLGFVSLRNIACNATPTTNLEIPKIEVFPTLFTNTISINYENESSIKIFSLTGENHFQQNLSEGKNEINLSHLKNGIYFIQLFDNKRHPLIVKKLVKIE